jgi:curved DNA-binding protein CbpA
MDPYQILGIESNATQEEIKQAYRRLAMQWHPDRNQNSNQAKERFHQAAEAYKALSEKAQNGTHGGARTDEPPENDQYRSDQTTADNQRNADDTRDGFADTVFWEAMLDYAIKLAQAGLSESQITIDLCSNGCKEKMAGAIADKAFNIHAHYASAAGSGKQQNSNPDRSTFKQERLQGELFRAFIGQRSFVWSSRDASDYYLVTFRALARSNKTNPLSWISVNNRLLRILNFCIVLLVILLLVIYYFPGPSKYKILADKQMLQMPFLLLPLMFVWMLYRRLWGATLILLLAYGATIAYYNDSMWLQTPINLYAVIPVIVVCFAPFIFATLFANSLYYLKARRMTHKADELFSDHLDQLVWVKNRSGTSATAAFLFALIFIVAMIHLIPRNWDYSGPIVSNTRQMEQHNNELNLNKAKQKTSDSLEHFETAEAYFNATPPDYPKAEMAYITAAANGSLLASYKLGYMHYMGTGIEQNDALAFEYFLQAIRAPLAFQPHRLELTTSFLGEAYNNLGIMYQSGLGTSQDFARAAEMYRRAEEFGSPGAKHNLKMIYQRQNIATRQQLFLPAQQ